MKLLGSGPNKYTRPYLHVKNIVNQFNRTSANYLHLYKQYGIFICQQSRSVLRTMQILCSFIANVSHMAFINSVDLTDGGFKQLKFHGDTSQPLIMVMKTLNSSIIPSMNKNIDSKVRAQILIQVIDSILKVPVPIPRCLLNPKVVPLSSLQVMFDPESYDQTSIKNDLLQIERGESILVKARGSSPPTLKCCTKTPYSVILLWYRLTPQVLESNYSNLMVSSSPPIAATTISPGERFFMKVKTEKIMKEGMYHLRFRIGCRDIRGSEWELPTEQPDHNTLSVRVVQS